jgi:hypothetical protein
MIINWIYTFQMKLFYLKLLVMPRFKPKNHRFLISFSDHKLIRPLRVRFINCKGFTLLTKVAVKICQSKSIIVVSSLFNNTNILCLRESYNLALVRLFEYKLKKQRGFLMGL